MKDIPETHHAHYILYLSLYYYQWVDTSYHWVDTSDGVLLVPEVIIRPVVSVSALIWVIRYIYY